MREMVEMHYFIVGQFMDEYLMEPRWRMMSWTNASRTAWAARRIFEDLEEVTDFFGDVLQGFMTPAVTHMRGSPVGIRRKRDTLVQVSE